MRRILAGKGVASLDLMLGPALAVIYLVAACLVFWRVYRFAIRTGLIARYSAETVS